MINSPTKKFIKPYQNEGRFSNNQKGQFNNNNQYDNQPREQNSDFRQINSKSKD